MALSSKTVLVVRATGRIGKQAVIDFLKAGANVIALDSPSHLHSSHQYIEELEINEEQRCRLQVEIICLVNGGGIKRLASRHTNVNVIINCFRYDADSHTNDTATAVRRYRFDTCLSDNISGSFLVLRHFIRRWNKLSPGCIVNVASFSGAETKPLPNRFSLSIISSAMLGLTKSIHADFSESKGLRCNIIYTADELSLAGIDGVQFVSPTELTPLCMYLASDESMISGAVFVMDNGASA